MGYIVNNMPKIDFFTCSRYPFFLRESRHDWVMDRVLERVPGTCEEMRFEDGGVWRSRDAR
jgi:hypothetical protein